MDKRSGIYEIRNTANGNFYIGSAQYFARRFAQHRHGLRQGKHVNAHLQSAWNKYGEAAFEFNILFDCEEHELIAFEQAAVGELQPKYNIAPVAGSQLGYRHTAETRAKMSAAGKGRPLSPARVAHLGRLSEFNRGRKREPHEIEHLKGNTFAHGGLGVKKPPGHGAKVSAGLTGKKQTPEHTENHAAALRGRKHTAEHRQKQSAGLRAYHARRREAANGH